MGKFPFKRPRIISKNFPEIDSHVDKVSKSLEGLVFSYSRHVDKTLQKKHLMLAVSSLALLVVLGSFISPKGKADSSIFYPETCLGGWINPRNAEGEPQTTSNGDASQFNDKNSAILPKNTNADIYCGNFTGEFDETTLPTKILVSLSLTKGDELYLETTIEGESFASSSQEILDTASTTEVSFTLVGSSTTSLLEASSSAATTSPTSSSTNPVLSVENIATTSLPVPVTQEAASAVGSVVEAVKDAILNLFESVQSVQSETDTVVIPPAPTEEPVPSEQPPQQSIEQPAPEPVPSEPTSLLESVLYSLFDNVVLKVWAQEEPPTVENAAEEPVIETPLQISEVAEEPITPTNVEVREVSIVESTTTLEIATSTAVEISSSTIATTTEVVSVESSSTPSATEDDENQFQNNFLEVFYTFDGSTWQSLGELNEISMKYRTFEIPVTASTSWTDMSNLQIKIESKKQLDDTPTVYLDGIKVEVLYETTLLHAHPDFDRDTILNDETVDGMRIVTIINNDNNQEEVWYMYLDVEEATSTLEALDVTEVTSTSTLALGSTTESTPVELSSTTQALSLDGATSSITRASSTLLSGTTTSMIKPIIPKNKWMRYEGIRPPNVSAKDFVIAIKTNDENPTPATPEVDVDEELPPDFALDIIKKIKGTFLNAIIVQLQKEGEEELWLYDVENNTQEKIDTGTSTSLSIDSPLGVKDGYVFWLSEDRSLVFAYNLATKEIKSQSVPPYDVSRGERGEVVFEGIPWKVILGVDSFMFFSEQTGEVFSDENSSVAEALRQKFKLDNKLDKEELSNLNLQVEVESVPSNEQE